MGRAPCCSKVGLHRGPWTSREDTMLTSYIQTHGEGNWSSLPKKAGLLRCGKSCRLRWMNYLRPDIKRGNICPEEEDLIIRLHRLLGNRWSLIAGRLPGRTDNEIKNYWNSHLSKKLKRQGFVVKETTPRNRQSTKSSSSPSTNKTTKNAANTNNGSGFKKIYAPKPTRLIARIETNASDEEKWPSSSSSSSSSSSDSSRDQAVHLSSDDWGLGLTGDYLFSDNGVGQIIAKQQDAVMLERLYDEYSQLLQYPAEQQNHMDQLFAAVHHDHKYRIDGVMLT